MGNTIFSIVTPSFNQGQYLEETIRSVISQRGNFFIDYIIMDGGSTDNSVEIIRKYDELLKIGQWPIKCKGITYRWKSEKDRGQVDAIKKGFGISGGDILGWLNSDDIFLGEDVCRTVIDFFEGDQTLDLLTSDGLFIDASGKEIGVHHVDQINLKELLYLDYHILQPSTFFRKEIYDENLLNEEYTCAFDADFFIGLIYRGARYKKINDLLSGFRIYPQIKTLALSGKRYREQLRIAWKYSKNIFYFLVSAVYRYFEIILKQKMKRQSFNRLFLFIQRRAYLLVTGKSTR
jgi:glycosyltransferase involved in cell wall biosynthesis